MALRPLLERLRDERGIALVMALGMILVLTVSVTTVIHFSSAGSRESSRSLADQQAHALAEAALNDARSVLWSSTEPLNPGSVPEETVPYEEGTATHSGELNDTTWTLTGVGTVRNPTGPGAGDVTRTLTSRVSVGGGTATAEGPNAVWNYIYADSTTVCSSLTNTAEITVPVFVRGDLCMSLNSRILAPLVQVGHVASFTGDARIGAASRYIETARIQYCLRNDVLQACSPAVRVYANEYSTTPEGLTKPPVDFDEWYANAKPGPMHPCTGGSFPGGFDSAGDFTRNNSRATVDLTPAAAYDCQVEEDGQVVGRLTWTPGSPGTLQIAGTIFFDGPITLNSTDYAVYQGRGTIYSSGKITFSSSARLCGVAACDATWDASANLLAFVSSSSSGTNDFLVQNSAKFQGAVYTDGEFRESNSGTVWGPIISNWFEISNSGRNHPVPMGTLLPGMPSHDDEVTTLNNVEGGYGE